MTISFDHTTLGQRVLFGTGRAAEHAAAAIDGLGARRVLLIGGAAVRALADTIAESAPVVARIDEVVQHVPVENGRAAVELAERAGIDAVLTIGGGSSTGLGKIVARDTRLPIVAIPTTFAGSEATDVWGQTEGERKTTGTDGSVLPKVIVYDASLSVSLPAHLAIASGLNAVAHAVDGFWAPRADPINTALGTEGIRVLFPGLRALHARPDDIQAREQTLYGAYLAAVAFASAGSGMHHKICHVLGGAYGLSHAEMHAIVLAYVTAFNAPAAPDAAARVSSALGGAPAAAGLYELRESLGVAGSLAELGLRERDIPEAARLATAAIPASNPRPFDVSDVEGIIRAAWAGEPVEE
ncbi:maleylacetate reductase [Microbacterium sp. SORGH_AS_0888]|uniref:maleylacetate reductase n=1 Tax=Microbacterium sp. SORGH_AS_0888 TaxID=3041791 RepID=UPI002785A740|nr:maleylacetate reductase [Microbacterium sp. SORGH_AS_0888]MDQ1129800.1 maleylacetate reductase [Microbacterium sp. SORGH_AS_0888]